MYSFLLRRLSCAESLLRIFLRTLFRTRSSACEHRGDAERLRHHTGSPGEKSGRTLVRGMLPGRETPSWLSSFCSSSVSCSSGYGCRRKRVSPPRRLSGATKLTHAKSHRVAVETSGGQHGQLADDARVRQQHLRPPLVCTGQEVTSQGGHCCIEC